METTAPETIEAPSTEDKSSRLMNALELSDKYESETEYEESKKEKEEEPSEGDNIEENPSQEKVEEKVVDPQQEYTPEQINGFAFSVIGDMPIIKELGIESIDDLKEALEEAKKVFIENDQKPINLKDEDYAYLALARQGDNALKEAIELKTTDLNTLSEKEILKMHYLIANNNMPRDIAETYFEEDYARRFELTGEETEQQEKIKEYNHKVFANKAKQEIEAYRKSLFSEKPQDIKTVEQERKEIELKLKERAEKIEKTFNTYQGKLSLNLDNNIKFNYIQDKPKVVRDIMADPSGYVDAIIKDESGQVDYNVLYMFAQIISNPIGLLNEAVKHGMELGKKSLISEKRNDTSLPNNQNTQGSGNSRTERLLKALENS